MPEALLRIENAIAAENAQAPADVRPFLAVEATLIRVMRHLVIPEMIARVSPARNAPPTRQPKAFS